ncbi:N-acetylmuramoyl-L-alanine amidase [Clostridium sp. UBA5119]|uniref:N-acetylmuramoyl-L-alanine amidase n=1 Tax=Clostridium sp. UBA5119 TaxID=1946366 RepID=UPI0032175D92
MIGAFIFGIGMVLAGGCVSGVLMRIGEGHALHWNIANSMKVELYFSIHINSTPKKGYKKAIGSEWWIYPNNENKISGLVGREVLKELASLGFINRGIKSSNEFTELSSTKMPAVIIECFFCNGKVDTDLYHKVGPKAIAYAIYLGIKAATRSKTPILSMNGININHIKDCHNCKNYCPI